MGNSQNAPSARPFSASVPGATHQSPAQKRHQSCSAGVVSAASTCTNYATQMPSEYAKSGQTITMLEAMLLCGASSRHSIVPLPAIVFHATRAPPALSVPRHSLLSPEPDPDAIAITLLLLLTSCKHGSKSAEAVATLHQTNTGSRKI